MRVWSTLGVIVAAVVIGPVCVLVACQKGSGSTSDGGASVGDDAGNGGDDTGNGNEGGMFGSSSGTSTDGSSSGGAAFCPPGLQCNVACADGATTTISGTVYDPAMKNPLYGITVYIPAMPLEPLPKGVPTGADSCSCAALFKSGAVVSTTTDVNGKFTLDNAPVGTNVQLVLQDGKWRHVVTLSTVNACQDNPPAAGKSMALNGTVDVDAGSLDNMPDIAVSTGAYDELECLMKRIGLPDSEFVPGNATTGHVHIFSGGNPNPLMAGKQGGTELHAMPMAPESNTFLWDSYGDLKPYDILLLSCEGAETYMSNPPNLEQYLNAGGRGFASHFHYKWFNGTTPMDWGTNLATWTPGGVPAPTNPDEGVIVETLNGDAGAFVKGQALAQWLTNVGALGQHGVPEGGLSIYEPQYNAVVGPANTPSQPWITDMHDGTNQTMYFSFDTPIGGVAGTDGGAPKYCGRAVFSDLHVSGDPMTQDTTNSPGGQPPPQGCGTGALSPQEKALEFMLFDLSACVVADTAAPPTKIPVQ